MGRNAGIFAVSGAVALMSLGLSGLALGQAPPPPSTGAASGAAAKPDRTDHELLTKSMQGNLAEIELGRLAVTHSTSPVIQGLGTRLAQDGSRGVANLQAIAGMLHVELPSKPSAAQERQVAELSKLSGPKFDAPFQRIALEDERKFLQAFQSGVSAAQNPAVKSTIKNMVPVVQEHIQIAQAIPNQYPQRTAAAPRGTAAR
jgi:putative membrane protein